MKHATRLWLVSFAAGCGSEGASPATCERLCDFALHCGFLPSSLGGRDGESADALRADCTQRCIDTRDVDVVDRLAGCFPGEEVGVCELDACGEAARCIQHSPLPDRVLGDATVTLRALDGVLWSVVFKPEVCTDADPMVQSDFGLDNYCPAFAGTGAAGYACAGLPDQPVMCEPIDCESPVECDPTMCDKPFITAVADCNYYGITSVQFGYRDSNGVLQLSQELVSCETASSGVEFQHVPPGTILPVALFRGAISPRVAADIHREGAVGRPFCWASWPFEPRRLSRAGTSTMLIPTPSTAQLIDKVYERNRDFPVGCGCAFETIDCEETTEDCQNGIDDDEDGLVDAEDFGCLPPVEQECGNGLDDDGDGLVDRQEQGFCERCEDGVDGDGDGKRDGEEPECVRCGDGIVGPGEECDDGDKIAGDGCDASCLHEGG